MLRRAASRLASSLVARSAPNPAGGAAPRALSAEAARARAPAPAPAAGDEASGSGRGGVVLLTESARARLRDLAAQGGAAEALLRVAVDGGGCSGFQYTFELVKGEDVDDKDVVFEGDGGIDGGEVSAGGGKGARQKRVGGGEGGGVRTGIVVDDISLTLLAGSTVDYTQELIRASFVVAENPNASAGCGCGASFSVEI